MAPLLKSYPSQVVASVKCPGVPVSYSTTVTTGVIAQTYLLNASSIQSFYSRFGSLYEEYRVVRVKFVVRCYSSTNPGLFNHWIDEKQSAAPTATEATTKSYNTFNASSPSPHMLVWTAEDPLDLQYTDIASFVTVATYKIYTDNTSFGSSIVATPYVSVTPTFYLQFRGYN